jgi:hypothetical protein
MPVFAAIPHTAAGPSRDCIPVTKSDTLNVFGVAYNTTNGGDARASRGLLVGTAGTATLVMSTGATRTTVPLQVGFNPLQVIQVKNAGTASDIWALI